MLRLRLMIRLGLGMRLKFFLAIGPRFKISLLLMLRPVA